MYLSHTYTGEGIQFRNISVSKNKCDFFMLTAITYIKISKKTMSKALVKKFASF